MTLFVIFAVVMTFQSEGLKALILKYIQVYGIFAVLVLAFLLDMLWQPVGPEVPISIAILFGLNSFYVFIFTLLGSYSASLLNYFLGRGILSNKVMFSMTKEDRIKYSNLFKKYGKWGLFVAAIGPIPWVPFCWLAGSFKMKFRRFVIYGLVPRLLRILVVVLVVRHLSIVFL